MYNYEEMKPKIFTDKGQKEFLKVRDKVSGMLDGSGAFMMDKVIDHILDDGWMVLAYVDRLVELGEIEEIKRECFSQHRVFIRA